jgi:hypothetical protein
LFKALSSQLDFVGLHLRGSIVLVGLRGKAESPKAVSTVGAGAGAEAGAGAFGVISLSDSPCRDVGRLEPGVVAPGPDLLCGRVFKDRPGPWFDWIELTRLRLGGLVTLHRLTLSDLFIIALWTKPPMPFVGELDRELDRVGDKRPGEAFERRPSRDLSSAASKPGGLRDGGFASFILVGVAGSSAGFSTGFSIGFSTGGLDFTCSSVMPGNCALTEAISRRSVSSTWFFR